IRKFLHGEPVIQGNDLVLNQRHGRIAASEAEQADLKETEKQMKVNHDGSPFLPGINVFSRPTAMQTRMITTALIPRQDAAMRAPAIIKIESHFFSRRIPAAIS